MGTKKSTEKLANFYLEVMEQEHDIASLEWKADIDHQQMNRWSQGEAALALVPPVINAEKIFARLLAVAQACQKWQAGPQPVSDEFINGLKGLNSFEEKNLIEALFYLEGNKYEWAKRLAVPLGLLDFIALATFKPILKAFGEGFLKQIDLAEWNHNHCPVCGDQPTMAKLVGKEGHRKLYCGRCETEWRFKRIGCPYCKDENSSQTTFITLDDCKQYRVYLCDRCKSYLKTVDERVAGEVDLFCEDLATAALDEIAQSEGYQRGDQRQQA
ncbi:formate dehydrogenase accessory protein FdhE [Desulfotomaculum sp. 1211_IL3151]|uniref:formate dehydrogenase accessory protein FdhE n=1 Tax=Desulfotomaculum sp. 1211_IL3151 TaxID=3084055 RepID=UPI002FDAAEFE